MLRAFVNIMPGDREAYDLFGKTYGPLFHGDEPADCYRHAANFRQAWTAQEPHEREQVSRNLESIFNEQFPLGWGSPGKDVVQVNFGDEEFPITIRPRSLLDRLVLVLLTCEHLSICANPECPEGKYFVAVHHKQQYCGYECANTRRKQAKLEWWKENRQGKQRSKPTLKTKRGKKQ
jgi:hypothetical protein